MAFMRSISSISTWLIPVYQSRMSAQLLSNSLPQEDLWLIEEAVSKIRVQRKHSSLNSRKGRLTEFEERSFRVPPPSVLIRVYRRLNNQLTIFFGR